MNRSQFWKPWIAAAAAAVFMAAALPAPGQYKPGHGVDATVYASPT